MNAIAEKLPTPIEQAQAGESAQVLAAFVRDDALELTVHSDKHGVKQIQLPPRALRLLVEILKHMEDGKAVTLMPHGYELTTQQAADMLNVSRPYLVNLLETGVIPHHKVGTHRRVRYEDVVSHLREQRRLSKNALDELVAMGQEDGDY